ncbi:hypothetical protein GWK47_045718 [Chionoecetes opilio]|uniref:Uncharacterized protein n=1 Tax=Chionoecetes opilio TaxID=41210 RepID=A0A8J5CU03_CHIOP|nr:hypothetical protein GWK47_045718 [Chionoecetes opilio]
MALLEEAEGKAEGEVLHCIYDTIAPALIQAKITMEKINDFKEKYTIDKFNMKWGDCSVIIPETWDAKMVEVCNVEQTCASVLPALLLVALDPPLTDTEAAHTLTQMTGHFLHFMYAYEQMFLDQALNEDNFRREMNDAYTNHNQLVGLLEVVQEACGVPQNASTLASLHGKMHVTTSMSQTNTRGFSTIRQSLLGLQRLQDVFWEGSSSVLRLVEDLDDEAGGRRRNRRKRNNRLTEGGDKKSGKNRKGSKRKRRRRHDFDQEEE